MLWYVTTHGRGESDRLLAALAARLEGEGLRILGAVQRNIDRPGDDRCEMELCGTAAAGVWRISQNLGPLSRGCRLDPAGLEAAAGAVAAALDGAEADLLADLVIVNKYGKQEIDGRGFRPVIAAALMRGLPVLTAVNAKNLPAFLAFAEGLAEPAPAEAEALRLWLLARLPAPAQERAAG
jgi:nucleoside-triphosphatase THEP1